MAQEIMKEELSAQLDQARGRLARSMGAVREDLDVGRHFKESLRTHKSAYLGGATLLGLLLAKLPARKKKIYVERKSKDTVKDVEKAGMWLVLLQFLFKTFRPAITSIVSEQLTTYLKKRAESPK